jgi:hypothetical protein
MLSKPYTPNKLIISEDLLRERELLLSQVSQSGLLLKEEDQKGNYAKCIEIACDIKKTMELHLNLIHNRYSQKAYNHEYDILDRKSSSINLYILANKARWYNHSVVNNEAQSVKTNPLSTPKSPFVTNPGTYIHNEQAPHTPIRYTPYTSSVNLSSNTHNSFAGRKSWQERAAEAAAQELNSIRDEIKDIQRLDKDEENGYGLCINKGHYIKEAIEEQLLHYKRIGGDANTKIIKELNSYTIYLNERGAIWQAAVRKQLTTQIEEEIKSCPRIPSSCDYDYKKIKITHGEESPYDKMLREIYAPYITELEARNQIWQSQIAQQKDMAKEEDNSDETQEHSTSSSEELSYSEDEDYVTYIKSSTYYPNKEVKNPQEYKQREDQLKKEIKDIYENQIPAEKDFEKRLKIALNAKKTINTFLNDLARTEGKKIAQNKRAGLALMINNVFAIIIPIQEMKEINDNIEELKLLDKRGAYTDCVAKVSNVHAKIDTLYNKITQQDIGKTPHEELFSSEISKFISYIKVQGEVWKMKMEQALKEMLQSKPKSEDHKMTNITPENGESGREPQSRTARRKANRKARVAEQQANANGLNKDKAGGFAQVLTEKRQPAEEKKISFSDGLSTENKTPKNTVTNEPVLKQKLFESQILLPKTVGENIAITPADPFVKFCGPFEDIGETEADSKWCSNMEKLWSEFEASGGKKNLQKPNFSADINWKDWYKEAKANQIAAKSASTSK